MLLQLRLEAQLQFYVPVFFPFLGMPVLSCYSAAFRPTDHKRSCAVISFRVQVGSGKINIKFRRFWLLGYIPQQ